MIRLGVISDTHGYSTAIDLALRALGEVDAYAHLGDLTSDAQRIRKTANKPVHSVRGNCDIFDGSPTELVVEYEGTKILLIHGHAHDADAYSTYAARERAEQLGCNALFYGHTHIPQYRNYGDLIVLNPGSAAKPRGGSKPSAALVEIENGRIRARLIPLE